ncbi:MAG: 50S ribosomal protein L25 [bacterium]
MSEVVLNVEARMTIDKKENKRLRRSGRVPAVYYIHGEAPIPLSIDAKEFKSVIYSESSVIDLALDGKKKMKCVVRDVQWHPVAGHPLHVDFMGIKLTEKVNVTIPVHVVGTSTGVKNAGGVMQQVLRELAIECLPLDIPEHLEVDISDLDVGDAIHVGDISIEGVKILNDADQSIAIVRPPTVAKEPEAVEEEVAEPEVVGEKKEEADETAGAQE